MHTKIITLIVFLFTAGFAKPIFAGDRKTPRLDWKYTLVLSTAMEKALKDYDPDFKIWEIDDFIPSIIDWEKFSVRECPSAVIADFNGDGSLDAALMGHNKKNSMILVLLSSGKEYRVKLIYKAEFIAPKDNGLQVAKLTEGGKMEIEYEYGIWSYLELFTKRKFELEVEPGKKEIIELKNDAFTDNAWEKAASLYYYNEKTDSFERLTIAD